MPKSSKLDVSQIADELCTCEHKRSEHEMSRVAKMFGGGISEAQAKAVGLHGHGACTVEGCPCGQFTWKDFIDKDGNILG